MGVEATFRPAVAIAGMFDRKEYPFYHEPVVTTQSYSQPDYSKITIDSKLGEIFPERQGFINSNEKKLVLPGMSVRVDDKKTPLAGDYTICRLKTEDGKEVEKPLSELTFKEFYSMINMNGQGVQYKGEDGAYGSALAEDDHFMLARGDACIQKRLAGADHHDSGFGSLEAAVASFNYAHTTDYTPEDFLRKVQEGESVNDLLDNSSRQISARTLDGTRPVVYELTVGDAVKPDRRKLETITESFIPETYRDMPQADYIKKNKRFMTKVDDTPEGLLNEMLKWLTLASYGSTHNHMMMQLYGRTDGEDYIVESFDIGYLTKNRVDRSETLKETNSRRRRTIVRERMHGHRVTFNKKPGGDHIFAYCGALKTAGEQGSGDGDRGSAGVGGAQNNGPAEPGAPEAAADPGAEEGGSENF